MKTILNIFFTLKFINWIHLTTVLFRLIKKTIALQRSLLKRKNTGMTTHLIWLFIYQKWRFSTPVMCYL